MWLLCPGLDNQYKLVFTVFAIGCLDVSETQWLILLVKGLTILSFQVVLLP